MQRGNGIYYSSVALPCLYMYVRTNKFIIEWYHRYMERIYSSLKIIQQKIFH